MTVKEFAEKAEISLSLAYALIAEGRVPHRPAGKTRRHPDLGGRLPAVHGGGQSRPTGGGMTPPVRG